MSVVKEIKGERTGKKQERKKGRKVEGQQGRKKGERGRKGWSLHAVIDDSFPVPFTFLCLSLLRERVREESEREKRKMNLDLNLDRMEEVAGMKILLIEKLDNLSFSFPLNFLLSPFFFFFLSLYSVFSLSFYPVSQFHFLQIITPLTEHTRNQTTFSFLTLSFFLSLSLNLFLSIFIPDEAWLLLFIQHWTSHSRFHVSDIKPNGNVGK